jgi:hypothetical protein
MKSGERKRVTQQKSSRREEVKIAPDEIRGKEKGNAT